MGIETSAHLARSGDLRQTRLRADLIVDKDSAPVEALGALDELSGWIEVVAATCASGRLREAMAGVLNDLAAISARIRDAETTAVSTRGLDHLRQALDALGGASSRPESVTTVAPFAHVARAVCQRAERRVLTLSEMGAQVEGALGGERGAENDAVAYLDGLSQLLRVVEDRARSGVHPPRE